MTNRIIASERFRSPTGTADAFTVLCENDIAPQDFFYILHDMPGLRTRLVHDYPRMDDGNIYEIIQSEFGDLDRFATLLAQWVEKHP